MTETRWPQAIQRDTWPKRFVPVPPPCGCVQSRSDRIRMWSGRRVVISAAAVEPATQERAEDAEPVGGGELLAGVARSRLVVHRYLEDLLSPQEQPRRDLGLDVEPARLERKRLEHVRADHLVARHQVAQVHVEEHVRGKGHAL